MSAPSSETRTFHMIEAVAERFEGAPRQLRRRWSDEFKAQVVTEALEPGASVSAIARRIGIHPSQLFAWRRDARTERRHRSRHWSCEGVVASVAGIPAASAVILEEMRPRELTLWLCCSAVCTWFVTGLARNCSSEQ